MKFIFYSPVHFEEWDWRNSVEHGIGGSETSHVEMAWRLKRRGHEVLSYAPIPPDCPGTWRGTVWKRFEEADFTEPGVWILYRCPGLVYEKMGERRSDQLRWLLMQDWEYNWQRQDAAALDRIMVLSRAHELYTLDRQPEFQSKMFVTSNAVKIDLIEKIEAEPIVRNPKKVIYASSPDRGLKGLLDIFKRAREVVPDLELHVFYGFNNIKKLMAADIVADKMWRQLVDHVESHADLPGFHIRGRVSQDELYREWLSAGIWCYPSNFWETSCITCMEAQCMGAIPLTTTVWAEGENTLHGIKLAGDAYNDKLVQARYVGELIRLATNPELQERIRKDMMPEARRRCDWENYVDQWMNEAIAGFVEKRASTFTSPEPPGCALCGGELDLVLSLGDQVIATLTQEKPTELPAYPLELMVCGGCDQLQLGYRHSRRIFETYEYRSGVNATMFHHLASVVQAAGPVRWQDIVVDIGANDGTLLLQYPDTVVKVAFEPSNIRPVVPYSRILYVPDFFSLATWREFFGGAKAKVVTAIAVLYSAARPDVFVQDVRSIIADNGIFIVEVQDADMMFHSGVFDTICHEHLYYFTEDTLRRLLEKAGFAVDIERVVSNGVTLRAIARPC